MHNLESGNSHGDRLKLALGISQTGVFDLIYLGNAFYCSPELRTQFGWDAEEPVTKQAYLDRIHTEDRARVLSEVGNNLSSPDRGLLDTNYRIIRRDGEIRWMRTRSQTYFETRGEAYRALRTVGTVTDITDKKLTENERRIAAIAFETQDAILITDGNKAIVGVNRAYTHLYGYAIEELVGSVPTIFQLKQNSAETYIQMWEKLWRKRHWAGELLDKRKNGIIFSAWLTVTAILSEDGAVAHYVCIVSDATEHKLSQDELQKYREHLQEMVAERTDLLYDTEQRYRLLVDGIKDCANFMLDKDGIVMTWNVGAERLMGYTADEIIGQHVNIFYPPEAIASRKTEIQLAQARQDGRVEDEGWRLRKDGNRFWASVVITALYDENNELQGYAKLTRDITERKQADEQLRDSTERIQAILDTVVDGIITINESGVVDSFNPAAEHLFGYPADEVVGRNINVVIPEPFDNRQDGYLNHYNKTDEGGIIGSGREVIGLRKDGSTFPMELAVSEMHLGRGRFFTGIVRDLTERKQFRQALILAKTQAERATTVKSAFLATMSHEIRTPMNGVIGMIDLLNESSLVGYQVEMVELIKDSAYSLLNIIEDILDFSKIEAGKLELENEPFQLAELVENTCIMMNQLADKKNVELTLFTDPLIPAELIGDQQRLRQVLVNLTNNAIKFSSGLERAGRVSVRAVVLAKWESDQPVVRICIADNGIGMDDTAMSKLFNPFTQADVSTTRRFGGTGLGLTISQHLMALMGGDITVESLPDRGSTFTINLPFTLKPVQPSRILEESPVSGLACFVVGKSNWLVNDIIAYLAHGGATVARIMDLTAARDQVERNSIDLWIWILDAEDKQVTADELRTIARNSPGQKNRFVVFERGSRRRPRFKDVDLVMIDSNALTRKEILNAVAFAAGRLQEEDMTQKVNSRSAAQFIAPPREVALSQNRLILVAEDNETNQKVIQSQLAMFGFAVDIANNGEEALKRWRNTHYALLLTDLHMPKMDGYELTLAIRAEETDGHRIPIIAVTANAIKGESDHCRAIGMDDYLSKPVQLAKLKKTLALWLPENVTPELTEADNLSVRSHDSTVPYTNFMPVDVRVLEALVGNDPELISEFLQDFHTSAISIAKDLKATNLAGEVRQVGGLAHKLKSSARSVGALALGELCEEIELAANTGQSVELDKYLALFGTELAAVSDYLDTLKITGNIQDEDKKREENDCHF